MDGKMSLYRECCVDGKAPNYTKIMENTVTFLGFSGCDLTLGSAPVLPCF